MNQDKITDSIKELLHDSRFVLWCLSPTEELDIWWRNWVEKYPEKEESVHKAKEIILSVKLNKYSLTHADSMKLHSRIQGSMIIRKKTQHKRIYWNSAAACIALLCVLGSLFILEKNTTTNKYIASIEAVQIDSTQTEVELFLTSQKKVQVKDKATIQINEKGNAQIRKKQITAVDRTKENISIIQKMNVLKVPRGRHSSIVLEDGTKIWVNSSTILQFPNQFEKDNRTIYADGEIYLEVVKDPTRPFIVKTTKMDVRVLGTSFNVTAYNDDPIQYVVLKEGSVSVDNHTGKEKIINPWEKLILEDDNMTVSSVNIYDYISWKDGILKLDRKKLAEVTQQLSRYYRVHFEFPSEIKDYICSGKLVLFDDIQNVMKTLQESFPISYKIDGDTIKLSSNIKINGL